MVHGLTFDGGKVAYRNRFVLTAGLRADRRAGRTIYGGLMNPIVPDPRFVPPDGDPDRFKNVANINVVRHAGRILALYEGNLPYELSPTLETKGLYDFAGKLRGAMTAHPKFDPASGEMLMFRYSLRPPFLVFYTVDATGAVVREVPIDTGMSFMVHDFVFTPGTSCSSCARSCSTLPARNRASHSSPGSRNAARASPCCAATARGACSGSRTGRTSSITS